MTRNRVREILAFDPTSFRDGGTFFNALVACLTPEEKCHAVRRSLFEPYTKRAVLMRRLVADMETDVLPCHAALMLELSALLTELSGKERVTCAVVLLEVAEHIPGPELEALFDELLASPNGNIRKQVYRRVKSRPEIACPPSVLRAWLQFGDFEACRLVIDRARTSILAEWFTLLERFAAPEGWLLARLYLRFEGRAPATLRRLERLDAITFSYVSAKLGRRITPKKLVSFYEACLLDQRAGLLVWSAGQMGLWRAVKQMKEMRQNPPERAIRKYYSSIAPSIPVDQLPIP